MRSVSTSLSFGYSADAVTSGIWSYWLGCFGPVQEGLREVRSYWPQYVISLLPMVRPRLTSTYPADIADVGKKVVDFYKKKGGEVISPLLKAF